LLHDYTPCNRHTHLVCQGLQLDLCCLAVVQPEVIASFQVNCYCTCCVSLWEESVQQRDSPAQRLLSELPLALCDSPADTLPGSRG
jgi:hypothetical protein